MQRMRHALSMPQIDAIVNSHDVETAVKQAFANGLPVESIKESIVDSPFEWAEMWINNDVLGTILSLRNQEGAGLLKYVAKAIAKDHPSMSMMVCQEILTGNLDGVSQAIEYEDLEQEEEELEEEFEQDGEMVELRESKETNALESSEDDFSEDEVNSTDAEAYNKALAGFMKIQSESKGQKKRMKLEVENFQLRVENLLEVILLKYSTSDLIVSQGLGVLLSCLRFMSSGGSLSNGKVLLKLTTLFKKLTSRPKLIICDRVTLDDKLIVMFKKVATSSRQQVLDWNMQSLVYCIRIHEHNFGHNDALRCSQFGDLVKDFLTSKRSKLNSKVFLWIIERRPEFFWPLLPSLALYGYEAPTPFLRVQAMLLLEATIHHKPQSLKNKLGEYIMTACDDFTKAVHVNITDSEHILPNQNRVRPFLKACKLIVVLGSQLLQDEMQIMFLTKLSESLTHDITCLEGQVRSLSSLCRGILTLFSNFNSTGQITGSIKKRKLTNSKA